MPRLSHSRPRSIGRQLSFYIIVLSCAVLATSLWNTWDARIVLHESTELKHQVRDLTKPASETLASVQSATVAASYYTRTQRTEDHASALAQFDHLIAKIESLVAPVDSLPVSASTQEFTAQILPLVKNWRAAFEEVARDMEISNRSVRGLGSQASLLITIFTHQITADN